MEHDEAKYKTRTAEYRYEPAGVTAPPWGICSFPKKQMTNAPGIINAWNWLSHNSYVYVIISEFR